MLLLDEVRGFRVWLEDRCSKATADTYCKRIATLLTGQPLTDTMNRLDMELLLGRLSEIKHKNHFSQAKNALLHFCDYKDVKLPTETLSAIEELHGSTKKKYRRLKPIEFDQVDKKIKHIRNHKLKLCYQTLIATGLRVAELSSLSSRDCTIDEGEDGSGGYITFNFIGKGGKHGEAIISAEEHPLLHKRLVELIATAPSSSPVFYSADYLQSQAKELGFTCHDLRRAYAKIEYKKCRNKAEVSKKLRHSNTRTTNIYLRSKVKI
jgi:integrase